MNFTNESKHMPSNPCKQTLYRGPSQVQKQLWAKLLRRDPCPKATATGTFSGTPATTRSNDDDDGDGDGDIGEDE